MWLWVKVGAKGAAPPNPFSCAHTRGGGRRTCTFCTHRRSTPVVLPGGQGNRPSPRSKRTCPLSCIRITRRPRLLCRPRRTFAIATCQTNPGEPPDTPPDGGVDAADLFHPVVELSRAEHLRAVVGGVVPVGEVEGPARGPCVDARARSTRPARPAPRRTRPRRRPWPPVATPARRTARAAISAGSASMPRRRMPRSSSSELQLGVQCPVFAAKEARRERHHHPPRHPPLRGVG